MCSFISEKGSFKNDKDRPSCFPHFAVSKHFPSGSDSCIVRDFFCAESTIRNGYKFGIETNNEGTKVQKNWVDYENDRRADFIGDW